VTRSTKTATTTITSSLRTRLLRQWPLITLALAGAAITAMPALAALPAPAHTVRPGIGHWWLPYNYSKHGVAIDAMFNAIFWLTTIVFIAVEVVLVVFMIKYRHRPGQVKGKFIHGNTRLEMIWTLIPAVILAVLALASKHIWDRFRYAEEYDRTPQIEVLVVGEQFQWNFVYPGKDGKFGQYLAFPTPADPKYRKLKYEEALKKINADIIENPLGQNQEFDNDPEAKPGQDDDYDHNPGRPLILPVTKPIAVRLSSKDVIHDFFLPNFRVKLDALPGMQGRINFTATAEAQSTEDLSIDDTRLVGEAQKYAKGEVAAPFAIWIDSATPGAVKVDAAEVSQVNYALKDANGQEIIQSRKPLTLDAIAALKRAGVTRVTAITRVFELACEELCGQGHYKMQSQIYFVSPDQYARFIAKDVPSQAAPKAAPGIAATPAAPSVASTK
jgi:cytochrome c oxidase subunit II